MANYSAIKAAVNAYIKQNGKKEITGHILNSVLNATIDSLGKEFQFGGVLTPANDPGRPDQNVAYIGAAGTYPNFDGLVIASGTIGIFMWNGDWSFATIPVGKDYDNDIQSLTHGLQELYENIQELSDDVIHLDGINEEDLSIPDGGKLQFANRVYNAQQPNGMGYVILRKNKTFAEQVTEANTIYEVRYPFTLAADFQIPSGCVLDFRGGSIDGAFKLDLNNCQILGTNEWIGSSLTIAGKTTSPCFADWFVGTDADKIEKALAMFCVVHLNGREYNITRQIDVYNSFALFGEGFADFFGDYSSSTADLSRTRLVGTMDSGSILNVRGVVQSNNVSAFGSFQIIGVSFLGKSGRPASGVTFTAYAGPSRPVVIEKCGFCLLDKGISFDTTAYDSSTVGTGCGNISIRNCVARYCNYGVYAIGRTVIGRCTIEDCVIEQNVVCGIKANSANANYADVGSTSLRIVNNLLEGQEEAIDIRCNGAYVAIIGNGFERSAGQNVRVFQTTFSSIIIEGNRMSNGKVSFYLTNCVVYARANQRSLSTSETQVLYLDRSHIVESDLVIAEVLGFCTANWNVITKGNLIPDAVSSLALDAYKDGHFLKKVDTNNTYVQASMGFVTFENNKNYVFSLGCIIPSGFPASKQYVTIGGTGFEGSIPDAVMRDNDKLIIMVGMKWTSDAPGLKSTAFRIKDNAGPVPLYITDVSLFYSAPKQVPMPVIGTNINQPTLEATDKGVSYFDSTLGKMIVWDGTAWVNMDGSALS